MRKFPFTLPASLCTLFALLCLVPAVAAQTAPSPGSTASSGQAADNALVAKAATMYYSTAKAGLTGFDCSVHPDWRQIYTTAHSGQPTADDDKQVALLNGVAIALHAHMDGSATLDWTPAPGSASDADSTSLLNQMHAATEQTLEGFVEFWAPFVDGSVIPSNTNGLTVTHAPSTFTLHAEQGGTSVTEVFSNDLLLEEYDVITSGEVVKFEPTYKATPQGLLVERFLAHIQKTGDPSAPVQEMHVGIQYQTIEGFPIPARLHMELVGTGVFNMTLDGCTVTNQSQ